MSTAREPFVIVGAGVAGLATAYHLARAGERVVVLERDPAPALRSSARSAAILRAAGGDAAVRALTLETARFLADPPPGFGGGAGPLCDGRGLVLCSGPGGAAALDALVAPVAEAGDARSLSGSELARLAPAWRLPEDAARAWLFPREGVIDVARLVRGLAGGARAAGATIRTGVQVRALERERERVRGVRLADGAQVAARAVVLAAGAWAGALGRAAGSRVALTPTRRHLAVLFPDGEAPMAGAPVVWDLERGFYARAERGGLLCCACDTAPVEDPDALALDPAALAAIREKVARSLDLPPASRAEAWAGLRTLTADGGFAIGPDPDVLGLAWVAGLGGAGMGAGYAAGRLAADLLTGGAPALAAATDPARLARVG